MIEKEHEKNNNYQSNEDAYYEGKTIIFSLLFSGFMIFAHCVVLLSRLTCKVL